MHRSRPKFPTTTYELWAGPGISLFDRIDANTCHWKRPQKYVVRLRMWLKLQTASAKDVMVVRAREPASLGTSHEPARQTLQFLLPGVASSPVEAKCRLPYLYTIVNGL